MTRPRRSTAPLCAFVLALCAASALAPPSAAALPGLTTGFSDGVFGSSAAAVRSLWLSRAAGERAGMVRLGASWSSIAPLAPPTVAAAEDPSWSGYRWGVLDAEVSEANADGLGVLITVSGAPPWAEAPGRPASDPAGTWRPNAADLGAFARAIATRYDGSYTPTGGTSPLPRVRYWQAWNEPNLSIDLAPQWRRVRHGYVAESPAIYRPLLNDFYAAVESVSRADLVLSAGTAPFGESPGNERMRPVTFDLALFCLTPSLQRLPCPHPAHFDILDHHPYSVRGPYFHALDPGDVSIADMPELIVPLRAAERLHTVAGARHHAVWATEVSWDSDPPDPRGVPIATQARWLEQTFYLLWSEGVSTVMWLQIVDSPPIPSYAASYQAGTYFIGGAPKPSARAFRFPFVVTPRAHARTLVWGKSPLGATPVRIELLTGSRSRTLTTADPGANGIFEAQISLRSTETLRARAAAEVSLPWTQRR